MAKTLTCKAGYTVDSLNFMSWNDIR